MKKEKIKRCPKCKGTRFSVSVYAYQIWDSEDDEWGEVEVAEVNEESNEGKPYLCMECGEDFSLKQIEGKRRKK